MKHLFLCLLIASSCSSCAMTGDPSEGGLFGWSQSMSNERISAREQYNRSLQADTAAKRAEVRRLEGQRR